MAHLPRSVYFVPDSPILYAVRFWVTVSLLILEYFVGVSRLQISSQEIASVESSGSQTDCQVRLGANLSAVLYELICTRICLIPHHPNVVRELGTLLRGPIPFSQ